MLEPPEVRGYRIHSKLGEGGAADVFEAEVADRAGCGDRAAGETVALKVLKPEALTSKNVVAAFEYEIRVLSRLNHPGIMRVHDSGAADGLVYASVELVEGRSLEQHLIRHQKLRPFEAVGFAMQLLEALDHVHLRGYVHRDVKPANLMLTPAQRLVLMDFGTAVRAGTRLDYEVGLYGTAAYLSPEQIERNPDIDARADLYAVGVLLYRMLAGRRPFRGLREDVLDAHLHAEPRPPSTRSRIPSALDRVVLRSLAKNRDDRYPSAREMWADLRELSSDGSLERSGLFDRLRKNRKPVHGAVAVSDVEADRP